MTREELLSSPEYWTAEIQQHLYEEIATYMRQHNLNKAQLAERLGCSKSYVTQLLNGDFDHKLSKFVELSLLIGKIPEFTFTDVNEYIENESKELSYSFTIQGATSQQNFQSVVPIIDGTVAA